VIGAHDRSLRFPYWVARLSRGGDVAVPASDAATLQYVDARDLGAFSVGLVEQGTAGAFHTCGPFPQEGFVTTVERIAARVAPEGTRLVAVEPAVFEAQGKMASFPLWSAPEAEGALALDPSRAIAAGLSLRALEDSVDDVHRWWGSRDWPDVWLTPDDERALLTATSLA
jgi:2'-hydroxyisoflavone reductase